MPYTLIHYLPIYLITSWIKTDAVCIAYLIFLYNDMHIIITVECKTL